jgi:hypothetical protein
LPQGRLVEVTNSYTLIPLDQPGSFAQIVRDFTHEAATPHIDNTQIRDAVRI